MRNEALPAANLDAPPTPVLADDLTEVLSGTRPTHEAERPPAAKRPRAEQEGDAAVFIHPRGECPGHTGYLTFATLRRH